MPGCHNADENGRGWTESDENIAGSARGMVTAVAGHGTRLRCHRWGVIRVVGWISWQRPWRLGGASRRGGSEIVALRAVERVRSRGRGKRHPGRPAAIEPSPEPVKASQGPHRIARNDKIKKCMRLCYAEISSPTDASVPAVPTVPLGPRPGAPRGPDEIVRDTAEVQEHPCAADQRLFDKEDFDPNACKSLQRTPLAY